MDAGHQTLHGHLINQSRLGDRKAQGELYNLYVKAMYNISSQNYLSSRDFSTGSAPDNNESSAFFVLEPGIDIELNLTSFFKLGLGVKYRIIRESNLANVSDNDLGGYSAGISFKFGKF